MFVTRSCKMSDRTAGNGAGQGKTWIAPRLVRLGRIEDVAGATKGSKQAGVDNPALIRS